MARLTADQWETVRAEREAGSSFADLAGRFGVSVGAIHKRSKAENWGDGLDVGAVIRRKVNEKVNGVMNAVHPKKRAEAIDAAAEKTAEVLRRHQEEPNAIRERLYAGLRAHKAAITKDEKILAFEDLKAAKIASETLINLHRLERQAHGLEDAATQPMIVIERSYGR